MCFKDRLFLNCIAHSVYKSHRSHKCQVGAALTSEGDGHYKSSGGKNQLPPLSKVVAAALTVVVVTISPPVGNSLTASN